MIDSATEHRGLFRLVYASRFDGPERDLDQTLRSVIAKSIQNNRLVGVTGFLLAGEGRFLQWLEGPAASVRETFQRISRDTRHGDLVTIADGLAERRKFRDWNMGQHRLGLVDQALLVELGLETFNPAGLDADRAERLLTRVGERHLRV